MKEKKENMIIDEQDLFGYIFFPENLSQEKKQSIVTDESLGELLEFYSQLKLNSERKPSKELKKKIAEKISAYQLSNVIILNSLTTPSIQKLNQGRLAASSKELTPQITTKTFVDDEEDYLIKILNYRETTKVFVFSTKDEIVKNFDIIIEPQNLKYHFEDNSEPLIINHAIEADKIQLKFA